MTSINGQKSSADLEREVNEQRDRVEARIGAIKDRLSPGQLIDEVLSYTKDGGGKFANNLGQQITANPLPAALVGVGLAWLIASHVAPPQQGVARSSSYDDDVDYPYAKVPTGGLRRVSHSSDDAGQWWSEFETGTGSRYKAQADSLGRRAGHFSDETGKKFSGFIDDAGNRIRQFQDESGNMLDDAKGWASHNWNDMRRGIGEQVKGAASSASQFGSNLMSGGRDLSGNLSNTVQTGSDQLTRQITSLFDQQPLIAGALAFAAGAALGAALPHTAQEDQLIGQQADKVRGKAAEAAGSLYDQGKQKAAEVYDDVRDKAGQVYGDTKDQVTDLARGAATDGSVSRH